jgi:aminoglycoside phosphotransferase (APT) family kinase protein
LNAPAVTTELDVDALTSWMDEEGLGTGAIESLQRLTGGTQNILVRFFRSGRTYILRRPPHHKRGNSDQTMRREARVLAALEGSDVPHPRLIAACADENVLGAAFYLMEAVEGFNPADRVPEGFAENLPAHREFGIGIAAASAAIARLDVKSIGLADLGSGETWLERQVPRWQGQLRSYEEVDGYDANELGPHDDVVGWLLARQPTTSRIGLIHGDYHASNTIVDPITGEIKAVVDWELATLGDPFIDLGTLLASWPDPTLAVPHSMRTPLSGLPTRSELVEEYARRTQFVMSDLPWFQVLACYRLAVILDGTRPRALQGRAGPLVAAALHGAAKLLITQATQLIGREGK